MPSPGLEAHPDDGPSHNARGLLVIGPQAVSFSDVLVKAMEEARLQLADSHYARGSPDQERKALKLAHGRRLYSHREAERQRRAGEAAA